MSLKTALTTLLMPTFGGRFWWLVPPDGFNHKLIFAIAQKVGGKEEWYVDQETAPSHEHGRVQIEVSGLDVVEVETAMKAVATLLRESEWVAEPYGAAVDGRMEAFKLYTLRQDFGIWYPLSP